MAYTLAYNKCAKIVVNEQFYTVFQKKHVTTFLMIS